MKDDDPSVLRTRAALALSFALGRYVPIPFLDDYVRERICRVVVARTASSRGKTLDEAEVVRLAASSDGCLGCLGALLWAPLRLLFYPIAVLLGLRSLSRDLIEVIALGRTIERVLDDGRYPLGSPAEERLTYARDVRIAFDGARRGLDLHSVTSLLGLALGPLRSVVPAAMRSMRRAWHGDLGPSEPAVEAPASRLAAALGDPRMKELLEAIDRRFDEALLRIRSGTP